MNKPIKRVGERQVRWLMIICSPVFLLIVLLFWWFSVPSPLFQDSTSTVLTDLDGRLLGARIAADHQWRFPEIGEVPEKFADAITTFEDRWFFLHPGVNPVSLGRALSLNIRAGKIVSGGSTITMQVIRLARKNKPRTYPEKVKEILMAFRLETSHTKGEILALYASHAPFGGNVVGLEAASWRYFGVSPSRLTWAQAATLAILPNCPGLIYPGRNPGQLLRKRDRLLEMMRDRGIIDQETCELAKLEPLPGKPFILPASAPHLLDRCISAGYMGKKIRSTVVYGLQEDVMEIIGRHSVYLSANRIYNVAAVVLDVNSGQTLAYAGNLPGIGGDAHANAVDIIISPRSTGSLLKPLLYAAMLDDGSILPTTLVPDIPTQIGGFIPENYNLTYDGAVPAKNALARSLNIPAVKMLQSYDYSRFYGLLRFLGMTTLRKPADHYGLSLILGGAEATLWDVASIYASMARKLNQYAPSPSFRDEPELYSAGHRAQGTELRAQGTGHRAQGTGYSAVDINDNEGEPFTPCYVFSDHGIESKPGEYSARFGVASVWLTFEAMVEVNRPDEDSHWQQFSSSRKIAWKTGTSFGNRDAWAVGVTPDYVVAVWVGNATGEGRPGLTGLGAAAPILFDIFQRLPATGWFGQPVGEMVKIPVCRLSGHRSTSICEATDSIWVQRRGLESDPCPFHHIIHVDSAGSYRVNSSCEPPESIRHIPWFTLPPVQEYYYCRKNPSYRTLPPFRPGCEYTGSDRTMGMIYPKNNSRIYIPVDLGGTPGAAVFKAAHRDPESTIYWHLDENYTGMTTGKHQMALNPPPGRHTLTLTDQQGETMVVGFEVMGK